jgi:uncharacterized membrane protein
MNRRQEPAVAHRPRAAARGRVAPSPLRRPSWELIGLAAAGLVVSGYLTWTKLTGGAPVCGDSGGCAIVQVSRFAVFLSMPTAAWGMAFYALVGLMAWRGLTARGWRRFFVLAVAGVAFSGYLTAVALLALDAACAWCLVSAFLTLAILAAVWWRRPSGGGATLAGHFGWGVVAAGVTVAGAAWLYAMAPEAWEPRQRALAAHLQQAGAVMYGAYRCPVCREQKAQFGVAADAIPYVECDPSGPSARPEQCARARVQRYPTWVIGGQTHEGLRTLDELARLSGFVESPPARSGG